MNKNLQKHFHKYKFSFVSDTQLNFPQANLGDLAGRILLKTTIRKILFSTLIFTLFGIYVN